VLYGVVYSYSSFAVVGDHVTGLFTLGRWLHVLSADLLISLSSVERNNAQLSHADYRSVKALGLILQSTQPGNSHRVAKRRISSLLLCISVKKSFTLEH